MEICAFYNGAMSTPILATKLYIPPPGRTIVLRPRLSERLNEGLRRKLTLISAPAGFGKTTLVSEWIGGHELPAVWLSLDTGDNDPTRFLLYLVAGLQTLAAQLGEGIAGMLQSPQPLPTETILTTLLNDITSLSDHFVLVLDDYHMLNARPIDRILTFLLEHLPPQMHLVMVTREDPQLPLARLRARDQLTELRAADLRFTLVEATRFLNQVMNLDLSTANIAALETRAEGWIAGLQLAAISLQGQPDATGFIASFTGSHHFVTDYLVEEVLQHQSTSVQAFLLRTSILDRLCGPLCDATLLDTAASGQATLEYLAHANLFIVPLDNERRWYRYHHLFADLLRQRLQQSTTLSSGDEAHSVTNLHIRASTWFEAHGLEVEAFHHATTANDIERAERLIEGKGIPRHFRGAVTMILDWLESLPTTVLNARPSLWEKYASLLLVNGQTTGVEEKLQAAEAALQSTSTDDKTRSLVGEIAAARATLALTRYQVETMLVQSRRALEYLPPNNLFLRATAHWTLGFAYTLQGERAAARQAITEAISLSQTSKNTFTTILATISLGNLQEADNQLSLAAETYRRVLQLAGEQPLQIINEAHLGLARVLYEWNDLDAAEQHGRQSRRLARQYDSVIDRFILCEVFLARLKLAQGQVNDAAALLAQASQSARQQNFIHRIPEVAAAQVLTFLRLGKLEQAAHLAQTHNLPLSQARVHLAQGDTSAALAALEPWQRQVESRGWEDERLKVMVLQAIALQAHGAKDTAVLVLCDALALAEPGGFIRLFLDEGMPMAQLLAEASRIMPDASKKLLTIYATEEKQRKETSERQQPRTLIEPLSQRELEVLQLIAQGRSNKEIGERLFLALDTVKGHNRNIFGKLQVQRRTEAVARAHELGLF